jgi:hypothetical protein
MLQNNSLQPPDTVLRNDIANNPVDHNNNNNNLNNLSNQNLLIQNVETEADIILRLLRYNKKRLSLSVKTLVSVYYCFF